MARLDPHSYCDSDQPQLEHLTLEANVDFASRTLSARATLRFDAPGTVDLDTRDLDILEVVSEGKKLPHQLFPAEPILGSRLRLETPGPEVTIRYRTSPQSSALQWLEPEQTSGPYPFLFSQCQAIHARALVPIQDTPRVRIRYRAALEAPQPLVALMAAAHAGESISGERRITRFEMQQPIPPYLLALAVGNLSSRELGPRSRVWAEPEVVEHAAHEFADVDKMVNVAERLFGPYEWERFDLLTMPRSFPYGGMENPRLTFVTPTLIAGDRSLANVVAHELAHSWTGNLITNANAEHFWLNEGWTVFAERRILEALDPPNGGPRACALDAALGRRALERACSGQFKDHPELTKLRCHLDGVDPDEAFSEVPYEKGYLFLRAIEEAVGRARMDAFVHRYVQTFRFRSITSEEFAAFVEKELPGALEAAHASEFLDQPGIPTSAPRADSEEIRAVERAQGALPPAEARAWRPAVWQLYLERSTEKPSLELCAALDRTYHLNHSTNYEILVAWLELGLASGYEPAVLRAEQVLSEVGRMKYLKPLYNALLARAPERARALFGRVEKRYHPIAQQVLRKLLA
jgi:aminopeptidase N